MGSRYLLKCLDSRYDQEDGMLVLCCLFEELGEVRIIPMPKTDFHSGSDKKTASDEEMHKLSHSFRGKRFNMVFEDDPNMERISDENYSKYAKSFLDTITSELEKVKEGLANDAGQIQRKLGRLKAEGKLDAAALLREENMVRSNLNKSE